MCEKQEGPHMGVGSAGFVTAFLHQVVFSKVNPSHSILGVQLLFLTWV